MFVSPFCKLISRGSYFSFNPLYDRTNIVLLKNQHLLRGIGQIRKVCNNLGNGLPCKMSIYQLALNFTSG